jgi:hypothetical protein
MYTFLEPHVRLLAAKHLGVGSERLVCDISLRDDLAATASTLRQLATTLEREFAVVVSKDVLDDVRSYGDLVHATGLLIYNRCAAAAHEAKTPHHDEAGRRGFH